MGLFFVYVVDVMDILGCPFILEKEYPVTVFRLAALLDGQYFFIFLVADNYANSVIVMGKWYYGDCR